MKFAKILHASALGAILVALAAVPKPAAAATDVESFYKSKVLTMYIGVSAGGGYDAYARMVARHIVRFIPGNPRMVAKNYTGAAGMRMLNSRLNVFNQAGSNVAPFVRSIVS